MPKSQVKVAHVPASFHKIKLMYADGMGALLTKNVNLLPNKKYVAYVKWQNGLKYLQWMGISNNQYPNLGQNIEVIQYMSPSTIPCFLCINPTSPGYHYHSDGSMHPNYGGNNLPNENVPHQSNNCIHPISTIQPIVKELEKMNFSNERLTYAKNAIRNKCVTSDQAYKIVELFNYEDDRVEIAKFCYDRMTDQVYANKLLDLFNFSKSRDEMRTYFTQ